MTAPKQIGFAEKDCLGPQTAGPDSTTLDEITRSARHATGASGAALILSDGRIMSCRACSGNLAPPVGTALHTETGFTATCVQTAQAVRCDDTKTDSRVDGSSCVELGIRSILAVPIFNAANVVGVLEVLSDRPQNFTARHEAALQLLARLVETLFVYVSRSDVSLESATLEAKPQDQATGQASRDRAELTCLSCRHRNPQDSQFCNRCGVVLFGFLGSKDTSVDIGVPPGADSNADEGLKQIRKIISGNGVPATWNEISEKLLADQRSVIPEDKPRTPETENTLLRSQEANGIKGRGGSVRRRLWL
jgi:hypothetical protein